MRIEGKKKIGLIVSLIVFLSILTIGVVISTTGLGIWTTDANGNNQTDFAPEETVYISGNGFDAYSSLLVKVIRPDGSSSTGNDPSVLWPTSYDTVPVSGGSFSYIYQLDGIEGPYDINVLNSEDNVITKGNFTDCYNGCCSNTNIACSCVSDCTPQCYDNKYWVSNAACCDTFGNDKGCKYNSKVCKQSCGATCDENSDCKCIGNKYASSATCSDSCSCQNQGGAVCKKDHCGAQCDATNACPTGQTCNSSCQCVPVMGQTPSVTIVADKIVCNSESDLPNWGGGGRIITSTTASDYVAAHPNNCHLESGWNFQWAFGAINPGDNIEHAETPWTTFGPTNPNGRTSVVVNNANTGVIELREELKSGYIPFTGNGGSDVTAEFYCDGDVLNYDNYDFINDQIVNGNTYYCVGFNALNQVCGNGIREGTEQCDGGACCNPDCTFKTAQTTCRESAGVCDVAETCTGDSATCPVDVKTPQGTSCSDGLFCNGAETCDGAGACLPGTSVTCNNPTQPQQCYSGVCDENKDQCVYTFSDTQGPVTSDVIVNPSYSGGLFNATALAKDTCSNINKSEYFLGHTPVGSCGIPGTGTPMQATDGDFNQLIENVKKDNILFQQDGVNWICIQSKDNVSTGNNWGNCACAYFEVDALPPECAYNIYLNNQKSPDEYLICGNNPQLNATVCDEQSAIQGGEFFMDTVIPPVPAPWSGNWMSVSSSFIKDNSGDHCSVINATVNVNNLADGTHYIRLRGKDNVENWGKIQECLPIVSFVKDTLPPVTTKVLNPAGNIQINCNSTITTADGKTITNGCEYVKAGTTIDLSAQDSNPGDGEYAGNTQIHYKVLIGNNCNSNDPNDWTVLNEGVGDANKNVQIILGEDSCHLIEYWATDGCSNAEQPHYELNIVDDKAPITTEQITGADYTSGGKTYLDASTRIDLTCQDQQYHPVGGEKIYYKYTVDGQLIQDWKLYTEPFGFPEESQHNLQYFCNDSLGNTETTHTETYYVDHTPPVTTKTYGTPFVTNGISDWITSQTPITLSVIDPDTTGHGCNSGVAVTKYRVTQLDNNDACLSDSVCQQQTGSDEEGWTAYSSPFTIGQQSCHLIEYYSVDNVQKTETVNKQCVFVDNTAPIFNEKQVGDPKVACSTKEESDCDYYVTKNTQICVTATDPTPHPVGGVTISCSYINWTNPEQSNGPFQLSLDPSGCFKYPEDSHHQLTCTATDALGNVAIPLTEEDIVDTQAPNVTKNLLGTVYISNGVTYINGQTKINLTCKDQLPHPVGGEQIYYQYSVDNEGWTDWIHYTSPFSFPEESNHILQYYCEDALGNGNHVLSETPELDSVDDTPPWIIIHNPENNGTTVTEEIGCEQSVLVEVGDAKSGVNESTIYAELIDSSGNVVRLVQLVKAQNQQGLQGGIIFNAPNFMDKQLPAGNYTLLINATDNVGNKGNKTIVETLNDGIFLSSPPIFPSSCTMMAGESKDCVFTYNLCARNVNKIDMCLYKIKNLVDAIQLNATISNNNGLAYVGICGVSNGNPKDLWLNSDHSKVNGKASFNLTLSFNSNISATLGTGEYDLNYTINSFDP